MGVPTGMERVATTAPYYRSTYVFVTRRSTLPGLRSLDDPRLRLSGVSLGRLFPDGDRRENGLVIAVTETVTEEDIETLASALREALA